VNSLFRSRPVRSAAAGAACLLALAAAAGPRASAPSFNEGWRFHPGDVRDGQEPSLNDSDWRLLDLPHDWSIEGSFAAEPEPEKLPVIRAAAGEWRFRGGDDPSWKDPGFADRSWQKVSLPANWERHSKYTRDNVIGWYRRIWTVPEDWKGRDILLDLGKIDDADETFFNGEKVGGLGSFPPQYVTAWDRFRLYRVPAGLVRAGGDNCIAVRVFDGVGGGGIYDAAEREIAGPFDSACPGGSGAGYIGGGVGWYRKTFELPESDRGKMIFVEFDGVYRDSEVWINGAPCGGRPYGYSGFQVDLTPHARFGGGGNVLAVRVEVKQPCSRWYSGAGIYRNVRLTAADPVHIGHWGVGVTTPSVSADAATIRVQTEVRNRSAAETSVTLETVIVDPDGREAAATRSELRVEPDSAGRFIHTLGIGRPALWSLENPVLYGIRSVVRVNGRMTDSCETPFGVRAFAFTADSGFELNGRRVPIRGVCLHHDLGCLGTAVNVRAIERQLEILKTMGCNAVRTSHNPPAPELLDLCDRMGFLVMDEAFDEWKRPKTTYGYAPLFDSWSERDLTDMIRRDRNHPSVVLWSIGNEIPEQDDPDGYALAARLAGIARREDPTRPVTSACNQPDAAVRSGLSKPLDVFGVNYSLPFYPKLKGRTPLIASETASAVSTRGHYNLVPDGSRKTKIVHALDNQCSSYDDATAENYLKAVAAAPWFAGEFVWTGFDYIGEPSPYSWPSVSSYFGIVDLCGFPKDRFYLYQSRWTDAPMVHLLPHWTWPGFEGRDIPVWCTGNCESVELFLDGRSLGEKAFRDTKDLHLEWKVPYRPGTLKAVAKRAGRAVAADSVSTAGRPAKIVLKPDRTGIRADGQDLSFIRVEIADREGRLCPDAGNTVIFRVTGAGSIAGVGNGNPVSHEPFNADRRKAFHGLALAVIRSSREPGGIRVTAESEGLEGARVFIAAE
jgi:beta-galactosidase